MSNSPRNKCENDNYVLKLRYIKLRLYLLFKYMCGARKFHSLLKGHYVYETLC